MLINYDYRFCVRASLQVMKDRRSQLCKDTLQYHHIVYNGLHDSKPEVQKLYFQYYLVQWFDSHWDYMQEILNQHKEYTRDQRKQMILFFAEYFSEILNNYDNSGVMAKLMIPNLLQVQKETLKEMLALNEKWMENSSKLKVEIKKHDEEFKRLIDELDSD